MTLALSVLSAVLRAGPRHAAGGHAGLARSRRCGRPATVYVKIVRNTPLTVVFFFVVFGAAAARLPLGRLLHRRGPRPSACYTRRLRLRGAPLGHQRRRRRARPRRPARSG